MSETGTYTTVDSVVSREQMRNTRRVLVLGLGNILLKDEGIGVYASRLLSKYPIPDTVQIIDAGTASLDVLLTQTGDYKLIVVDAMRGPGRPGTIYKARFENDQAQGLEDVFGGEKSISLHQVGLIDASVAI